MGILQVSHFPQTHLAPHCCFPPGFLHVLVACLMAVTKATEGLRDRSVSKVPVAQAHKHGDLG